MAKGFVSQMNRLNVSEDVRAYLICAMWADGQDSNGTDRELEFDMPSIIKAYNDIAEFRADVQMCGDLLSDVTDTQLGHDLWLTRNHHGAGFWDRDFEHGDKLTEIAHAMGECNIFAQHGRFYLE